MATMRARTVALAAVSAGAMLCGAVVCEPARADVLAFENTQSNTSEFYATLELFNSSDQLVATVSSEGNQGSIINLDPAVPPSLGGAAGGSTNYTAGLYDGSLVADYFLFDLTGVTTQTVTSAALVIYSGTITNNNLMFNLSALSDSTIAGLTTDQVPPVNTALYAGLVSGASYGSFPISATSPPSGSPGELLTFTITDPAALAAINEDIIDGNLGIGGSISGINVPEPSTWIMMLAGFAGLGLVARRAARRRAAAAAG